MDPILVKALREYRVAMAELTKEGTTPTAQQREEFFRVKTEGKFGFSDAQKVLGSIDETAGDRAKSLGRSAMNGLTLGFADEILGAMPKFLGGGEDAKEEMRMKNDAFRDKFPGYALGSEVVGSLGLAGAGPELKAGSAALAMLKGAAVGGAAGAVTGAGNAEGSIEDRGRAAAAPGVVGAGVGALLPGLGALWEFRSPAARAARRLDNAIEKSGGVAKLRDRAKEFGAADRGKEVMLGDLADPLRREADFAANASDDVLVPLAKAVRDRQADASGRIVEDVRSLAGDANAPARAAELESSRRAWAAGPEGYQGLRDANPSIKGSEELFNVLSQPKVKDALAAARQAGLIGNEVDKANLSFQKIQDVKELLDDAASAAFRQGRGNLGSRLKEAHATVEGELVKHVPNYAEVSKEYASRMKLERALEEGEVAWDQHDTRGLAKQVAAMTPEQLEQFRHGMTSKLIAKLRGTATNRGEAKALTDASPALRDKLQVIFGDKTSEFMQRAGIEAELGKMRSAVGGSETARRLQSQGFDPAEIGLEAVAGGPHGVINQLLGAAKHAQKAAVTRGTARELGPKLLTQGLPDIEELLRQWGLRAPAHPSALMKAGVPAGSIFDRFRR